MNEDLKQKYKELMFSKEPENIDTLEGLKLKFANLPILYKYQKIDEYSLANLENNTAWFSNASKFNDPYDSALTIKNVETYLNGIDEDFINKLSKIFNVHVIEIETLLETNGIKKTYEYLLRNHPIHNKEPEAIQKIIDNLSERIDVENEKYVSQISNFYQNHIYATCFSEDPTSMLMWSHYGANHEGMVLEYNFNQLDLKVHGDILSHLHPIIYTDELLNIDDYKSVRELIPVFSLAAINKSNEWSYEKEWRVLLYDSLEKKGQVSRLIKPSSIILGARVSKVHKIMLAIEGKKRGIPVKQIKLDKFKYHLSITEVGDFE